MNLFDRFFRAVLTLIVVASWSVPADTIADAPSASEPGSGVRSVSELFVLRPLTADPDGVRPRWTESLEGLAEPIALASGDLDEDGVPDLICGYADASGGLVTVHRGNVDAIHPDAPGARRRRAEGGFTDSPFLQPARVFEVPARPDFLASGDFDGDGHRDVLAATGEDRALWMMPGDGRGGLRAAKVTPLPGVITAVVAGEINRADGLVDLVVAVAGSGGPALLVYQGPEGALRSAPERLALDAEVATLALDDLDGDAWRDLVAGTGSGVAIVHGRDRRQTSAPAVVKAIQGFDLPVEAVAIGDFRPDRDHLREIAVLAADDATVHVLERDGIVRAPAPREWLEPGERSPHGLLHGKTGEFRLAAPVGTLAAAGGGRRRLVPARLTGSGPHDLIVVDGSADRLVVLTSGMAEPGFIELERNTIAVLPMRLNGDALSDLVVLREGTETPVLAVSTPRRVIRVDHNGGGMSSGNGRCTLREAIANANADADFSGGDCNYGSGLDVISFDISGGGSRATITLNAPLEDIIDSLILDGNSQGCSTPPCIVLDGSTAGSGAAGLVIDSSGVTVRGLAIHSFAQRGIIITNFSGNVIEGNFIGTDATGTTDLGNGNVGLQIQNASNTTVGGTTGASRNVISGNDDVGIFIVLNGASGNTIEGNYIGVDATGTAGLGNGHDGIMIDAAPNNTIGGTTAGAGNVVSANADTGIQIYNFNAASGATGNLVQGNLIGVDVTGTVDLGNTFDGVVISGTPDNTIGGTVAGAGNVVSGNDDDGIHILNEDATGNYVLGNLVGVDITGTADLGNFDSGVVISINASNNTIGGTVIGARNVISGNDDNGLHIVSGASSNVVQGNLIGTDVLGTLALGNTIDGVLIDASSNNTIGGTTPGAGNVISGNDDDGLTIFNPGATENLVAGNFIGTNLGGTAGLGNADNGIVIADAPDNTVGGTTATARNVISSNGNVGLVLISPDATGNRVEGNYIGTDVNGSAVLGNADVGVLVIDASNNTVGGTIPGSGNLIAGNQGPAGVTIDESSPLACVGNAIQRNSMFSNSMGVDLSDDGVTTNDTGDGDSGPNYLVNFPMLTSASVGAASTTVSGTLDSTPGTTFRLEFFSNLECSTSGHGEGEDFLGSSDVTTDGAGDASFAVVLPVAATMGDWITATATASDDSTSEYSACVAFVDNCPLQPFGQNILAPDENTLSWTTPKDVRYTRGDLAGVATYSTLDEGVVLGATSLDLSGDVVPSGSGSYYLIRERSCGSWQTAVGAEPGRDLEFRLNAVGNGGTEAWDSPTDLVGWVETATGGPIEREDDLSDVYGGFHAVRLTRTGSGTIKIVKNDLGFVPGRDYTLSFMARAHAVVTGAVQVRIRNLTRSEDLQDDGTWSPASNFFRFDMTTEYQRHELQFTVDPDFDEMDDYRMIVLQNATTPIGTVLWIDDVAIRAD